jgi:hypothetical protein
VPARVPPTDPVFAMVESSPITVEAI